MRPPFATSIAAFAFAATGAFAQSVTSISISGPATIDSHAQMSAQYTAIENLSDGTSRPATGTVFWAVTSGGAARFQSNDGVLHVVGLGPVTIEANDFFTQLPHAFKSIVVVDGTSSAAQVQYACGAIEAPTTADFATSSFGAPATADILPLCDGKVLFANTGLNRIQLVDVASGQLLRDWQLSAAPRRLLRAPGTPFVFVTLAASVAARIDLGTGEVATFAVAGTQHGMTLGEPGEVWISHMDGVFGQHSIARFDIRTLQPLAAIAAGSNFIAYDAVANSLFVADAGYSPSSLMKYSVDPATGSVQPLQGASLGSNGESLQLAPNRRHLVKPTGSGNGLSGGYTMFDIDPAHLDQRFGEWNTDAYPTDADFRFDSRKLLATNRFNVYVYDVATHVEEMRASLSSCMNFDVRAVRWSPAGRNFYALADCTGGGSVVMYGALPAPYGLQVSLDGAGTGSVAGAPGSAIACGDDCLDSFAPGSTVALTAAPGIGSTLQGWSGCTAATGTQCTVTMNGAVTVTATFAPDAAIVPRTVDFGAQSMATTSPAQTIAFTNHEAVTVAVSAISVAPPFEQTNDCATLAPGASCTITLTFTPGIAAGALNAAIPAAAVLRIDANDGRGPHTVAVAGTAEKSLVAHYYASILRRAPDTVGKAFWAGEAQRVASFGANVNEAWFALAATFFASPEYAAFARDDVGFATDLYRTFFNRAPDAAGLAFWKGQLTAGLPREVLLASFMFSPEFKAFSEAIFGIAAARAEVDTVLDFYRGAFARLPDADGFAFWVQRFREAQCRGPVSVAAEADIISLAFFGGGEYSARASSNAQYVGDLYQAFLRRGGDLAGVQFWIAELAEGRRTRDTVRRDLMGSPEFATRLQAVTGQGCVP